MSEQTTIQQCVLLYAKKDRNILFPHILEGIKYKFFRNYIMTIVVSHLAVHVCH